MLLETHFLAAAGASLEAANRSTYTTFFSTTSYLFACACFVLALKWLSQPATARKGNTIGQIGMLAAVVGALLQHNVIHYEWIFIGFAIGAAIGVPMAVFMPMTAVPQRTALSHAFGALAAALVAPAPGGSGAPATTGCTFTIPRA